MVWPFARRRPGSIPSRVSVEVREEIRFHLEMRARELVTQGLDPDEAWRRAVEAFGDPEWVAEESVRESGDAAEGGGMARVVDDATQDIRFAVRNLTKARGFTVAAVLTLALGIGGTASVYSVVHGVLLRPLPFDEPDRLVAIWSRWVPESGYDWPRYPIGSPEYFDYLRQNRSMEAVAAVSTERLTFTAGQGGPEMVTAGSVSPSLFTVLRVPPLLGRTLLEGDGGANPAPVVVLSYDFWQRRFGGDSTVVGRTLQLGWENEGNDVGSTVVGVMPQGFRFPDPDVEVWAPLLLDPERTWRGGHWFSMIGRLAPGVGLESAQAEMATLMDRWRTDFPDHHRGHFLYLTPLLDDVVAGVRPTLLLLLGAVAFVLLIACANVASLLLARGQQRTREMAVRAALGAGRTRLVRQLLTEAAILATVGAILGLALSAWGADALLALQGGTLPRLETVRLDGGVLAFSGILVVLATLMFGVVPAGTVARMDLARAFSDGGSRSGSSVGRLRLRRTLVVSEITLSVLLVVGAGLMTKSLWHTLRQDPGFDAERLLVTRITFPRAGYTAPEKLLFMERLADRVRAHPEVEVTATAGRPPLLSDESWTRFGIPGRPETLGELDAPTASMVMAGDRLFATLGISLVRGRLFDATDRGDSPPVAVIDETMAERYWPGEDPIGQRIQVATEGGEIIIGVVTPARFDDLTKQAPTFYLLDRQMAVWAPHVLGTVTLLTRTLGDPAQVAGHVRDVTRELDPELPILMMRTMTDMVGRSVADARFLVVLLCVFAGLALVMGFVGVYGVIAQAVSQRTNEIGVRRALGADAGDVLAMVLGQGLLLALLGIALGLVSAALLGRLLEGFLYQVSTTDPWTYVAVGGSVAAVAVLATLIPARRASQVDPMEALRTD